MARWGEGYITDLAYTNAFFRETTPVWLAMIALLRGQCPPDLSRPFRYADLGCGNGFTATVVAATMPQAEVWGFDFNPAHIETASRLAMAAGLTNVQFREASFAELAALPDGALPAFDFVVCHGVLTHISPENRRTLTELIGRWLVPGGLAYLGYNVTVGWAGMEPARRLLRMLAEAAPGGTAAGLAGLPGWIGRLHAAGARHRAEHPGIAARMESWMRQDPRYLAHEYLGESWQPLMFAEVADAMAAIGCGFIGSATLVENIDALSLPPGCIPLLAGGGAPRLQETIRDFARAQAFRRDIYRRGLAPLPEPRRAAMLDVLPLLTLGWRPDRPVVVDTAIGSITANRTLYQPMLEAAASGSATLGEMLDAARRAGHAPEDALQAAMLLVAAGCVCPAVPGAVSSTARARTEALNRALIQDAVRGVALTQLVAPAIGAALGSDLTELLLVGLLLDGELEPGTLGSTLRDRLGAYGDPPGPGNLGNGRESGAARLTALVRVALTERVPVLRRLGVVPKPRTPAIPVPGVGAGINV